MSQKSIFYSNAFFIVLVHKCGFNLWLKHFFLLFNKEKYFIFEQLCKKSVVHLFTTFQMCFTNICCLSFIKQTKNKIDLFSDKKFLSIFRQVSIKISFSINESFS